MGLHWLRSLPVVVSGVLATCSVFNVCTGESGIGHPDPEALEWQSSFAAFQVQTSLEQLTLWNKKAAGVSIFFESFQCWHGSSGVVPPNASCESAPLAAGLRRCGGVRGDQEGGQLRGAACHLPPACRPPPRAAHRPAPPTSAHRPAPRRWPGRGALVSHAAAVSDRPLSCGVGSPRKCGCLWFQCWHGNSDLFLSPPQLPF